MANIQEDDTYVISGPESELPLINMPVGQLIKNELLNTPIGTIAMVNINLTENTKYFNIFR